MGCSIGDSITTAFSSCIQAAVGSFAGSIPAVAGSLAEGNPAAAAAAAARIPAVDNVVAGELVVGIPAEDVLAAAAAAADTLADHNPAAEVGLDDMAVVVALVGSGAVANLTVVDVAAESSSSFPHLPGILMCWHRLLVCVRLLPFHAE